MKKHLFIAFCSILIISSCTSDNGKSYLPLEHELVGKWMMHKVYQKGNDITQQHNPENNRWVKFTKNGHYASGGEPYGLSMGNWRFDVSASQLEMVSEKNQTSNWEVSLRGDKLTWRGTGDDIMREFKFVLKRNKWKNS